MQQVKYVAYGVASSFHNPNKLFICNTDYT